MNNNIKSKMRDDIIVQMQQYLDNNTFTAFHLQKIESVTKDHNSIPGSDQNAADIHG